MTADLTFAIANDLTPDDRVVVAKSLPALTGNGSADILCGACGQVLAEKLIPQAICDMFQTRHRLILRCTCGGNNFVPCDDRNESAPAAEV